MTTTDPTITIAGLRATIEREYYREQACTMAGEIVELQAERRGHAAERQSLTAERDDLAAQLAEVRTKLDATPKVCAIHSYEHGPGPCMTCGAWPPGTRELIAACRTRIAGLEQAANERSRTVAAVTVEELADVFVSGIPGAVADHSTLAGICAVLASLKVATIAPVDPEVAAKAIQGDLHRQDPDGWTTFDDISDGGQAEMVDAVRAALTAAGIPVTPERK